MKDDRQRHALWLLFSLWLGGAGLYLCVDDAWLVSGVRYALGALLLLLAALLFLRSALGLLPPPDEDGEEAPDEPADEDRGPGA